MSRIPPPQLPSATASASSLISDDRYLPKACVVKVMKRALEREATSNSNPQQVHYLEEQQPSPSFFVSDHAKQLMTAMASEFVCFVSAEAADIAVELSDTRGKPPVLPEHIYAALQRLGMERYADAATKIMEEEE